MEPGDRRWEQKRPLQRQRMQNQHRPQRCSCNMGPKASDYKQKQHAYVFRGRLQELWQGSHGLGSLRRYKAEEEARCCMWAHSSPNSRCTHARTEVKSVWVRCQPPACPARMQHQPHGQLTAHCQADGPLGYGTDGRVTSMTAAAAAAAGRLQATMPLPRNDAQGPNGVGP